MVLASPQVAPERSATIRLRGLPWLRAGDELVPVAIYLGDPGVLVSGCDVLELSWSWGASRDQGVTSSVDAGTGVIRLLDPDRRYDPLELASSAGIATTVRIEVAGVPAFRGRVDDFDHDLDIATLTIVDDVSALAGVQFVETSVPAEVTSARVTRILDLAGWVGRRDIGAGGVQLQAGTVASDAWSELLEVTRNELGALWLSPAGDVTYRTRSAAWATSADPPLLGCPPSLAPLTSLELAADQSSLVNVLSAARRGGTQTTVVDGASLTRYGRHSHVQNDLELASDGDRDLWASFYITRSREPARGVASATAVPGASAIAAMLAQPFGAILRVLDSGHGPDIDVTQRWLGTRWTITPESATVSVSLGTDQSIRQVSRTLRLDLGTDFAPYQTTPAPLNAAAREPGVHIGLIPQRPAQVGGTLLRDVLEAIDGALDDAGRPTPNDDEPAIDPDDPPGGRPARRPRKPKA